MSKSITKHLPWIAPVVAIGVIGSGALNYFDIGLDGLSFGASSDQAAQVPAQQSQLAITALQGYAADQIIMVAPSDSQPVEGLPTSRVDFDLLVGDIQTETMT